MNTKATLKMIEKDKQKLVREDARGEVYIAQIIKEQKALLDTIDTEVPKLDAQVSSMKEKLLPYMKDRPMDDEYRRQKAQYERLLMGRNTLLNARSVCEETIAEAELRPNFGK